MAERWSPQEWEAMGPLLASRSHGRCEVCGQPLTTMESPRTVRHHRQRRAVGGDRLSNILLIHGSCHLDVHAHPEGSREKGWIVSVYLKDPSEVPVHHGTHGMVLLDDVGATQSV